MAHTSFPGGMIRMVVVAVGIAAAAAFAITGCTSILGDYNVVATPDEGGIGDVVTGSANGAQCATNSDCATGHCADGVCCNTACNGVCESCALDVKGTCTPFAAESDPEHECANVGPADGGTPPEPARDGGREGGALDLPDGGGITLAACAGVCDGHSACRYPNTTVSCGPAFCPGPAQPTSFHCDGKGGCARASSMCTAFVCDNGACRTNCAGNGDCQAQDYCNANGQCVPKKDDGVLCSLTSECKSGYCVAGPNARVCCNSSCNDTGMQCDIGGKEGNCSCGSLVCPNGCRLFYVDSDGDGHGDPNGTLGNQRAVAGCIGTAAMAGPIAGKKYYPNNDDCDDLDPNAFPGQTAFFDTANPRIGFDYNCSMGSIEKELPEWPGMTCKVCTLYYPLSCQAFDTCAQQCCGRSSKAGFRCGFACDNGGGGFECCPLPGDPGGSREGFEQVVGCGTQAAYHVCGTCNAHPTNTSNTPVDGVVGNKTQRCH